jgi:hypothetical protein
MTTAKKSGRKKSQGQGGARRQTAVRASRSGVLRRPPTSGLPRLQHEARRRWRQLLEIGPLWLVLFVLICTWCLLPRRAFLVPRVEAGSIADRTYIADRDLSVANEAATRLLQQQAREEVLPIYDFDRTLEADRRLQLATLFQAGRASLAEEAEQPPAEGGTGDRRAADLVARIDDATDLKINPEQIEILRRRGFATETEDRLSGILTRLLRQGVVSDKELLLEHRVRGITVQELPSGLRRTQLDLYRYYDYPEQLRQAVEQDLLSWDGLSSRERQAFAELIVANVAPNLTFNNSATLDLKGRAAAEVGTVFHTIRRGEVVVRKGARVDALAERAIDEMASSRDLARLLLSAFGTFLLLGAAALLVWLACGEERRRDRSRERFLGECLILLTLHVAGARLAYFVAGAVATAFPSEPWSSLDSYVYAIPFASLALLSVLLYNRDMALVLSLVFSLLVGHVAEGESIWRLVFYTVAGSLAAVYALDPHGFKQRSAMIRAGAVVGTVNMVAILALEALSGQVTGGAVQVGFDLLCGFAGGLLASAVASFSAPIFETLLSATTAIKLIELANPNLPLLRRLALEAPGTFQHSLAVANLAKSGCEAIDGDSVWVNTGALYHDIGKIFRPRYFVENQIPGQNPHDKIQPSMSALILINHVKEGLEMAHRHSLPQPIVDAIEQHHGTRLIKFFYTKAQDRCDPETEEVREEEFRYPGPKPQSKEMGVLMLADAVEAASRTLVDPSRQKLRSVLRAIFDDCLHDHQLDQTDLTLGDLRKVEDAFLRVLVNVYHRRIDYPGFDFNRGGDRGGERGEPAAGESEDRKPSSEARAGERRRAS